MPTIDEIDFDRQQRIPMSFEEYLDYDPGLSHITEWVDGVTIVTPPARLGHDRAVAEIAFALHDVFRRDRFHVFFNRATRTSGTKVREPDVTVFPVLTDDPDEKVTESAPIIAVEVLSPSTRGEDLIRKPGEYLRAGVRQYWVVDWKKREILVLAHAGADWQTVVILDEECPTADVAVGEHGVVPLDLDVLLPRR